MTILAVQYDKFSFVVLISYHCWNWFQVIPVIVSLHFGSKNVRNCNQLLTSVMKIVNEWDDEEILNRVGFKFHSIYNKQYEIITFN